MLEKSLLAVAGVAVVGVVGYKIVRKKNPKLLTGIKDSVTNAKKNTGDFFEGAAASFKAGYSSAV